MHNNLQTFIQQFENWVLGDIRLNLGLQDQNGKMLEPDRTPRNIHRPFVGAVILICCAIDCLAAYRFGRANDCVGLTFKNFIIEYFRSGVTKTGKSYDARQVYNGLRNALVHGYNLSKDLALDHTSGEKHLKVENGRVIIDVYSLYDDLDAAYQKYKSELLINKHLPQFDERWSNYPLIQYIEDEELKK